MNYLDVYYSRINHMGETIGERIRNGGIRSFERWLSESPFTIWNLSVERGLYFSGIIEMYRDKEEIKRMNLYVSLDIPIKVGDIMLWRQDDGSVQKWLLLQERAEANPKYRTFWIIRCNYEIKWIDKNGRLKKSWAYAVSSVDSKIKNNFRMWHNLISPQPNKFAEIIMPRQEVDRGTNFIIEDEGWKMVEADFTSVEGIIYMSLTESKVNYQYDDLEVDVADTDKLQFPTITPLCRVGDTIVPDFNGETFNEWELELFSSDTSIIDADMRAIAPGMATITMQLKGRKAVQKYYEVRVEAINEPFIAYIDGADSIKLDRQKTYSLVSEQPIIWPVVFTLRGGTELATLFIPKDEFGNDIPNQCVIYANKKNKLGEIVLVATCNGIEYTKTIKIVPLW